MGLRLTKVVKRDIRIQVGPPTFWSDSATVLGWTQSKAYRFQTFVSNRVGEILEESEPGQWRHVPGILNPADDASRGLYPHQLTSEHRWLNGPGFLKQGEDEWLLRKEFTPAPNDPEIKSHPTKYMASVTKMEESETIYDRILKRTNSAELAVRILAWICRPLYRKRNQRTTNTSPMDIVNGPLHLQEIKESKKALIKSSQRNCYAAELKTIQNGRLITK